MPRQDLSEIRERFLKGLSEGLDEVVEDFVDESTRIIEQEAVDQGTLKNSVEIRRPGRLIRVVAWTADHAKPVHYGSRPHWAPIAPIMAWVRRNLRTVILSDGGRETRIKPGPAARTVKAPEAIIRDVAYAVRAKIAKEGTSPVPWVPRAIGRVRPRIPTIMAEAVRRNR